MSNLRRTLGLPMLIFYGVGMILGAGIYSIIGKAAAHTGDTLWLGFLMAGVAALLTALSYAELSTMFPKAGAEFVYLREAFKKNQWIGSTIGVAMSFSGAATAATVALAFSGYLGQFITVQQGYSAALLLVTLTILATIGLRESGWLTVVSTLIEIGGLFFVIYLGISTDNFGKTLEFVPHLGTFSGTALIIFSYFGFESLATLAEETREPERTLPRSIIISVVFSTCIYILVSLSALTLLSAKSLAESSAPLMAVAQVVSTQGARILGVVALFSTVNTALISMIGASRIMFSMASEKVIPEVAATLLPKRKTPWVSSMIVLLFALILIGIGNLETVAGISALTTLAAFAAVNISLIILRYSQSTKKRPFRVPFSIGRLALLPLLGAIFSIGLMTQFNQTTFAVAGCFLVGSAIVFKFFKNSKYKKI